MELSPIRKDDIMIRAAILSIVILSGCAGNQVLVKKSTNTKGYPPIEQMEYKAPEKGFVFNMIPWATCIIVLLGIFYLFCRTEKHKY